MQNPQEPVKQSPEVGSPEFWAQTTFETGITPREPLSHEKNQSYDESLPGNSEQELSYDEQKELDLARQKAKDEFMKSIYGMSKRKIRRRFSHPGNSHTNQVKNLLRRLNLEQLSDKKAANGLQ